MNELLKLRNNAIWFYKKNELFMETALKMIGGAVLFASATSFLPFGKMLVVRIFMTIAGAVLATVAGPSGMLIFSWLVVSLSAAMASVAAGVLVFVSLFLLYLFYGRICPRESLLFAAMLVLYKVGLAYAVPVAAAIYMGPAAIIPVCLAVMVHNYSPAVAHLIEAYPTSQFSLGAVLDIFEGASSYVFEAFASSSGWVVLCAAVAASMMAVWFVSTSFVKDEKEKAILAGGAILMVGGFASLIFSAVYFGKLGILGYVLSVAIGCAVAYIMTLFECVKDYGRTEKVVFQDNDYVYYVKAVPKVENIGGRVRRTAPKGPSAFEKVVPEGAKNILRFGSTGGKKHK
ncbi:MAG: hypothetical protein IKU80_00160 [Firmicutes bacterium]|nr:hypothetical protein [Bacillota bacterium]